jgi:hypothetical protein
VAKGFDQVNAKTFGRWYLVLTRTSNPWRIEKQTTSHYFPDHDVFYWRSDWSKKATAFAFKCGPPEGHHTEAFTATVFRLAFCLPATLIRMRTASSFLRCGQYLTGDTG